MKMKNEFSRKPSKCPECGPGKIADIHYGMPGFSNELQKEMESGRIVIGGCCITDDDPMWQCADCHADFYKTKAR
jgi:hypothetical protein